MRTVNLRAIDGIDNLPDASLEFVDGISNDGYSIDVRDANYNRLIDSLGPDLMINNLGEAVRLQQPTAGAAIPTMVNTTPMVAIDPPPIPYPGDDHDDEEPDNDDDDDDLIQIDSPERFLNSDRELATRQPIVNREIEIGRSIGGQTSSDSRLVLDAVKNVEAIMTSLTDAIRKRDKLMEVITSDSLIRKVIDGIEATRGVDKVQSVEIVDSYVLIKTDELVARAGDVDRLIGHMGIYISLQSLTGSSRDVDGLRVINYDRRYGNYQCGHVSGNTICLGKNTNGISGEVELATAIADVDIANIAQFMIKWIMNPNINDSWGVMATKFPIHEGGRDAQ